MIATKKVRENRCRRAAKRRGFTLSKARRYDHGGADYGLWMLLDHKGRAVNPPLPSGFVHSWSLERCESFLADLKRSTK
jgi:hypothetical protein